MIGLGMIDVSNQNVDDWGSVDVDFSAFSIHRRHCSVGQCSLRDYSSDLDLEKETLHSRSIPLDDAHNLARGIMPVAYTLRQASSARLLSCEYR